MKQTLTAVLASAVLLGLDAVATTSAQTTSDPGPPVRLQAQAGQPAYTLKASTRLVIEDVLVTDSKGHAVAGLPRSAFHVTDDKHPQQVRNFEERFDSAATTPAGEPAPRSVVSNASLVAGGSTINVLLLDNTDVAVEDQMYLRLQALRYLKSFEPGTRVAVFRTTGAEAPVLMQSVTSDRELLVQAIKSSVPAFTRPQRRSFSNAIVELENISDYLGQYPSRKSLIWFSARFPLYETPLGVLTTGDVHAAEREEELKVAYRSLERARIAVFPVDVRGVVNVNLTLNQARTSDPNVFGTNDDGATAISGASPVLPGGDLAQRGSWQAMEAIARATGGRAFYSNNALTRVIQSAVDLGRRSYVLTYTPQPYERDGRWHTVKLTVDGPYTVSYREGYFADDAPGSSHPAGHSLLRAREIASAPVSAPELPIVFAAKVTPAAASIPTPKKGSAFQIQYAIRAKDLEFDRDPGGSEQAQLKFAAIAYNGDGDVLNNAVDNLTTHFSTEQFDLATRIGVPMLQTIGVPRGAQFLLLSVVDLRTGRTGTLQLSLASARESTNP